MHVTTSSTVYTPHTSDKPNDENLLINACEAKINATSTAPLERAQLYSQLSLLYHTLISDTETKILSSGNVTQISRLESKVNKLYLLAAQASLSAAQSYETFKMDNDAAEAYLSSGESSEHGQELGLAATAYLNAAKLFTTSKNISGAANAYLCYAKTLKKIAENLQSDNTAQFYKVKQDYINAFLQAAKLYEECNQNNDAAMTYANIADFYTEINDKTADAITAYASAGGFFFKAGNYASAKKNYLAAYYATNQTVDAYLLDAAKSVHYETEKKCHPNHPEYKNIEEKCETARKIFLESVGRSDLYVKRSQTTSAEPPASSPLQTTSYELPSQSSAEPPTSSPLQTTLYELPSQSPAEPPAASALPPQAPKLPPQPLQAQPLQQKSFEDKAIELERQKQFANAAEQYNLAANKYKDNDDFAKAAFLYSKAADCYKAIGENNNAAISYDHAGSCWQMVKEFDKAQAEFLAAYKLVSSIQLYIRKAAESAYYKEISKSKPKPQFNGEIMTNKEIYEIELKKADKAGRLAAAEVFYKNKCTELFLDQHICIKQNGYTLSLVEKLNLQYQLKALPKTEVSLPLLQTFLTAKAPRHVQSSNQLSDEEELQTLTNLITRREGSNSFSEKELCTIYNFFTQED